MREATFEELTSIDKFIDNICEKASTKTFYEYVEEPKEESLYDKMKHSLEELYDEYTIEVIQGMVNKALKEIEEESKSE